MRRAIPRQDAMRQRFDDWLAKRVSQFISLEGILQPAWIRHAESTRAA